MVDVTGIVLAGGRSLRMGRDKRFLELGGKTLLDRVLAVMGQIFPEVLLVLAGEDPNLKVAPSRVVTDRIPGCAAMGGLYTGLIEAGHQRVFAAACDMPFVRPAVVRWLIDAYPDADVVVPELPSGPQPMHAVYSRRCLRRIEHLIQAGCFRLQDLLLDQHLVVQRISSDVFQELDPQLHSFWNLNTPSDFEEAERMLVRQGGPGDGS